MGERFCDGVGGCMTGTGWDRATRRIIMIVLIAVALILTLVHDARWLAVACLALAVMALKYMLGIY